MKYKTLADMQKATLVELYTRLEEVEAVLEGDLLLGRSILQKEWDDLYEYLYFSKRG